MPGWALLFLAVYMLLAFGLRSVMQKTRTGSTGFKGISGEVGSTEWIGGVLFALALALGALAPSRPSSSPTARSPTSATPSSPG